MRGYIPSVGKRPSLLLGLRLGESGLIGTIGGCGVADRNYAGLGQGKVADDSGKILLPFLPQITRTFKPVCIIFIDIFLLVCI